ncbi:MAG: DNA repair protein RecN, partial [Propionibacteriaceae bacterium]|nr:DNA repair protein RecN [Propionibacteriaceae bacterium]
ETLNQLADADAALADVAASLSAYLSSLEADPIRLEWIAGRRAELQVLTRKYGETIAQVLQWSQTAAARVLELDASDTRIAETAKEIALLDGKLADLAEIITKARLSAADQLAKLTAVELRALAMPQARLIFEVTPLAELGAHGGDRIRLLFAANIGSGPGQLSKIASGGELSRVRLALEVVLAASQSGQTFVFDEVDAGVGGQVALEVGRRLARLAEHSQVIVVTHLAQVAAFADRHFVVTKTADGQVTTSAVSEVQAGERLETLAKMMSGLDSNNDASLAHAAQLLTQARK